MQPHEQKIVDQALDILGNVHRKGEQIASPNETKAFLRLKLSGEYNEVFGCIFLTTRNTVISVEDLFFGTIDGATVHPRVIVQKALEHNAGALIVYHNHPSGIAEPSRADENITRRVQEALSLIDVRLIDHLVIGGDECVSFAERGLC